MTEPQARPELEEIVITLQYTLKDINDLINMMNKPFATPVMAWANFINDVHLQIGPQIQKLNEENTQNEQG